MTTQRVIEAIREICFRPTFKDRRAESDMYFMEITSIVEDVRSETMMVGVLKKGLRLTFNPEFVATLSDVELRFLLNHEAQHLRRNDNGKLGPYLAARDWYNGWDGMSLCNMAADAQINDYLTAVIDMPLPADGVLRGGVFGPTLLGHLTHEMDFEELMREIAEKIPPMATMQDIGGDNGSDSEGAPGETHIDLHTEASAERRKAGTARSNLQSAADASDVARWGNYLAEIMDTRKQEDTWQHLPKRLSGVPEFSSREYVRPAIRPLPRKTALIAIDTSGSMDAGLVRRLCSAVRNSPVNYELEVICFNTETYIWGDFRTNPTIPNLGGGTDLTPVVQHVGAKLRFPERILVLTDGCFEMPELVARDRYIFGIYGADAVQFSNEQKVKAVQLERLFT